MKAMILAAGRGERMKELTDTMPKPLLKVKGKALIEHRIIALAQAGFKEIIINLHYLGDLIAAYLGDGSKYGVKIQYSWEVEKLDVGGGIKNALPLLGREPFVLTSSDAYTDFPFQTLQREYSTLAHLVLVENPPHNLKGDFDLVNDLIVCKETGPHPYSYGNFAVFQAAMFDHLHEKKISFMECILPVIKNQQVTGEVYKGLWTNVDTSDRLQLVNQS